MQTICLLLSMSVFIILWLAGWGLDAETPFVAVAELPVESMAGDVDVATITVIALHTDITVTGGTTALANANAMAVAWMQHVKRDKWFVACPQSTMTWSPDSPRLLWEWPATSWSVPVGRDHHVIMRAQPPPLHWDLIPTALQYNPVTLLLANHMTSPLVLPQVLTSSDHPQRPGRITLQPPHCLFSLLKYILH